MLMALLFPASPPPTAVGKVSAQRKQPVLDGGGLYFLSGSKTRNLFIRATNSDRVCARLCVSLTCTYTQVNEALWGIRAPVKPQQPSYFSTITHCSKSWRYISHQAESLLTEPHISGSCSFLLPFVTIKLQRKHFYFPQKTNPPLSMWPPFKSM